MSEKWGIGRGAKRVELADDELMHWKYIERYKRNGKWVYVYANEDTHKKIHNHLRDAKLDRRSAEFFKKRAAETDIMKKGGPDAYKLRREAQRNYENTARTHENEAIWLIEHNTISALSKKKIDKAKAWVEDLFKEIWR